MKVKDKRIIIKGIILFILTAIIVLSTYFVKKVNNQQANLSPEILRSMNYKQITDEDSKVENTDFVKFSAFFTRDLDGDGNAEKLLGTCRNINSTDQLYIDLNVLTNGYLKDGVITINGTNFKYNMSMMQDEVLKNNYISDDVKTIELNQINAGTQKLILGDIKADIKNNINNYSKINTITLTGTHVSDNGEETTINKTINLNVDWHGTLNASLYTYGENVYYNLKKEEEKSNTISINFSIDELNKELLLKDNIATVTIPDLNGYTATEVTCKNENVTSTYNAQNKKLTLQKSSIINDNGIIEKELDYTNVYTVNITYPKEAFESLTENTEIKIPVEGYYVAYNNKSEEFINPIQSNTVSGEINVTFRGNKQEGYIYDFSVNIVDKVYNKRSNNFIISKQELLDLYENNERNENNEENENNQANKNNDTEIQYTVAWKAYRGTQGKVISAVMNETAAEVVVGEENENKEYGDKFNQTVIENYTSNKALYFEGYERALQTDGAIYVYNNDTDKLIKTFTIEELKTYTKENPYIYETPVKHIRIETTTLQTESTLTAYNVKQLDTGRILQDFTKEEIKDVKVLYTYLTGTANTEGQEAGIVNDVDTVYYQSEKSYAEIKVEQNKIPTQETIENQKIYIQTIADQIGDSKWKNGEFVVEIPEEIVGMEINSITTDNSNVTISAQELSKVNGKYILKILTENENPEIYTIMIDCTMTSAQTSSTELKDINLYAYNQYNNDYYITKEDIYDVNTNDITEEQVGFSKAEIELQIPTKLITYETVTNYNKKEEIIYAPNVAEVENTNEENTEDKNQNNKGTAKINIGLKNNYTNTINGVQILGKIPFEGNKYILNGENLNSKFTAQMTEKGIELPEELKENAIIYYSENENASKDLESAENGWTLKENVQDFTTIKTYLIVINEKLEAGKEYTMSYTVIIPDGVNYNLTSYSTHAVYYELATEEGNIEQQTEPNKVGIRPVKKYNLSLTNYKINSNIAIPGATYILKYNAIDKQGNFVEKTKILTTDENGKIELSGLYTEIAYKLQQTKVAENYELNNNEITFTVDEEEMISLNGNVRKQGFKNDTLKIELENETKYTLNLLKQDERAIPLNNIRFNASGDDLNKTISTTNGKTSIEGLHLGKTYILAEQAPEGFYFDSTKNNTIEFKLERNEQTKELEITTWTVGDGVKQVGTQTIVDNNDETQPILSMVLENERIPVYNLKVNKVDENGEKLDGAEFKLTKVDDRGSSTAGAYNGEVTFENLYEYIEGKNITGEYILQEMEAPYGYVLDSTALKFKATRDENGILQIDILSGESIIKANSETGEKEITSDEETLTINIINKIREFTITKIDEETKERIPGVEFDLYSSEDSSYENVTYMRKITTDENGEIKLQLPYGYYKAVEVKAADGYALNEDEEKRTKYFKVEQEPTGYDFDEINYIEDLVRLSNYPYGFTGHYTLMRNLDFNDDSSYKDPNSIQFGDYNNDGKTEGIKAELTSGNGFKPICLNYEYSGVFDGKGYEIRNLYINRDNDRLGLFGKIEDGTIENLGITGNISGKNYVGGIAGHIDGGSIINCYNRCNISGQNHVGGIAGLSAGSIVNCYNIGDIRGFGSTGGIVGLFAGGSINNCHNVGNINNSYSESGNTTYAGGIAGYAGASGSINNCYNTGNISYDGTTSLMIGGIAGNVSNSSISISNCYNTGSISCGGTTFSKFAGGIVGDNNGNISNCYNIGSISYDVYWNCYAGGIAGTLDYGDSISQCYYLDTTATKVVGNNNGTVTEAESKTKEEMQDKSFCDKLNINRESQTDMDLAIWIYNKNSYPTFNLIQTKDLIITNKMIKTFTITKVDEETKAPLKNVKFAIYNTENGDFAKDLSGKYIGNQNKDGIYVVSTDENGKIKLSLPEGYYKAVEIETLKGYEIKEDPVYFSVGKTTISTEADIEINYIEDLVDFSNSVRSGNTYSGQTIRLMRTLDFNDDKSYRNPNDTSYRDYNGDNKEEGIKVELTSGQGFEPIGGTTTNTSSMFAGVFDGNGCEIKNLYINRSNYSYVGLFSGINNAKIADLGIAGNSTIIGGTGDTGAIVGYIYNSNIINCYNTGTVSGSSNVGGIAGRAEFSSVIIRNCYNTGDVNSEDTAGGIIGNARNTNPIDIKACYNTGNIKASRYAGGITGISDGAGVTIHECYNRGYIYCDGIGDSFGYNGWAGGICGFGDWSPKIYDCYNLGTITGMYAGGIVVSCNHGGTNIANCYNEGTIFGNVEAAGISAYSSAYIYNSYNSGRLVAPKKGGISSYNYGYGKNNVYLDSVCAQGIFEKDDEAGIVEAKTEEYMKSEDFCKSLNANINNIDTNNQFKDIIFSNWIYEEGKYPTLDYNLYSVSLEVTIENKKKPNNKETVITKVDKDTKEPISNVKFAIYNMEDNTFAKNKNGEYIGIKNENDIYTVTTDANGQLKLNLPEGYYKAVEIETIEGYQRKEEPTYFTVEKTTEAEPDFNINNIEDLVDLSNRVNAGESFEGKTIKLMRTLDFNDEKSYRKFDDTQTYGNYNGDATTEGIKAELTKGTGFKPIGINSTYSFAGTFDGNGFEIRNIYINNSLYADIGLFGHVNGGNIKNIGLTGNIRNNYSYAGSSTGGIVGNANKTSITNCHNKANINITNSGDGNIYTGGIVGFSNGTIENCYNTANIYSYANYTGSYRNYSYTGGIAGRSFVTSNSYNTGYVHNSSRYNYSYVGGITGSSDTIVNCYNIGNTYSSNSDSSSYAYNRGITGFGLIVLNSYWLSTTATDGAGKSLTSAEMQSEEFVKQLNDNKPNTSFVEWEYNQGDYPTFTQINFIEESEITITNKKLKEFTITKVDKETQNSIPNTKFSIYSIDESKEIIDFAKDGNGKYIGTLENDIYVVTTNESGKITLKLPNGNYKAVEVQAADGYVLEESEISRTTYFAVGEEDIKSESTENADLVINSIEDLVKFSNDVNSGNSYAGQTVVLARTLDFEDDASYNNPTDTSISNYNGEIKTLLTDRNGQGFIPIGRGSYNAFRGTFDGNNHELKNIYISNSGEGIGLFGYITNGKVRNLGLTGGGVINCYSSAGTGGIAGYINHATIENCYNSIEIKGNYSNTGGIVGNSTGEKNTIVDCYNMGTVTMTNGSGGSFIAGIIGYLNNGKVINCYNIKDIDVNNQLAGGVVGYVSNGVINNCYNTGNISSESAPAGGLACNISSSKIINCYNTGSINRCGSRRTSI